MNRSPCGEQQPAIQGWEGRPGRGCGTIPQAGTWCQEDQLSDYSLDSHRTRPLVFLSTEAAKLWVTPTRLVPSTSTSKSFTWILGKVTLVIGP